MDKERLDLQGKDIDKRNFSDVGKCTLCVINIDYHFCQIICLD